MRQLLVTLLVLRGVSSKVDPHITHGELAEPGQFPFTASIVNFQRTHICGGSIISYQWVLTAAHCQVEIGTKSKVHVGTITKNKGGRFYNIFRCVVHERFYSRDKSLMGNNTSSPSRKTDIFMKNDIALLQIEGKIKFNRFVQPIKIGYPIPGQICHVVGWGKNELEYFSNELLFAENEVVNLTTCRQFERLTDVDAKQICTLSTGEERAGACSGDSGGPLVTEDGVLVGIVSFGDKMCTKYYPQIYTSPLAYSCWIAKHTKISMLHLISDL